MLFRMPRRVFAVLVALGLVAVAVDAQAPRPASADSGPEVPAVSWVQSVPESNSPVPNAISPDGSTVFVLSATSGVEAVSTSTHLPVASWSLPTGGGQIIAFAPSVDGHLYVVRTDRARTASNAASTRLQLFRINTASGAIEGPLTLPGAWDSTIRTQLYVSPDSASVYVESSGLLDVVSAALKLRHSWKDQNAVAVGVAPNGALWLETSTAGAGVAAGFSQLELLNPETDTASRTLKLPSWGPFVVGVLPDQNEAVLVDTRPQSNYLGDDIWLISLADGALSHVARVYTQLDLSLDVTSQIADQYAIAADGSRVYCVQQSMPASVNIGTDSIDLQTGAVSQVVFRDGWAQDLDDLLASPAGGLFAVSGLSSGRGLYYIEDQPADSPLPVTPTDLPQLSAVKTGATASVTAGSWAPAPDAVSYQWYSNYAPIPGATGPTLAVTSALYGKPVFAVVTASADGSMPASIATDVTWPSPATLASSTPTISGRAAVGSTLTASAGKWTTVTALAYQWKAGGVSIPGATHKTFTVTADQRGRSLTVTVTGSLFAYATVSRTSAATATVPGTPPYRPTVKPALAGADRYATAVAISKDSYPTAGSAKTVVVTAGENFPDALSAAPAAVKLGGPLLLATKSRLPSEVGAEIKRLRPKRIVVVGGTAAVSASVQSALSHIAPTVRVAGADRYATSLAIDKFAFGSGNVSKIYFATGTSFPDALSASAFAGGAGVPVLLVPGNTPPLIDRPDGNLSLLPAGVVQWVRGAHVKQFDIVGGRAAISDSMETAILTMAGDLGAFVYEGADRFETNRLVIDDNPSSIYSGVKTAYLASGMNFPDALAGAAAAGKAKAPLILVKPGCVPAASVDLMQDMGITTVKLLGGPAALSSAVAKMTTCK